MHIRDLWPRCPLLTERGILLFACVPERRVVSCSMSTESTESETVAIRLADDDENMARAPPAFLEE